jgi:hypothetical protein
MRENRKVTEKEVENVWERVTHKKTILHLNPTGGRYSDRGFEARVDRREEMKKGKEGRISNHSNQ